MGSDHTYNPYCCLLPSQRAVAIACWRLGVQPDYDTWIVILEEAAVIEESSHPPHQRDGGGAAPGQRPAPEVPGYASSWGWGPRT